jgi:phytoene synthase
MPTSHDARTCAALTRKHARTFAFASTFLPRRKQRGTFALYAFCRRADDLVDRVEADRSARHARADLAQYRADLAEALAGDSGDPAFRELAWTVQEFGVPTAVLKELLDGIERDLTPPCYRTWDELRCYAEGVASSVGEMLVHVFGVAQPSGAPGAVRFARTLGVAMQLTNILRDVGEDARRGRCYLPHDDLASFGLTPEAVLAGEMNPRDPSWHRFVKFQIARARELYREGARGIELLSADSRRCTWICAAGYAAILGAVERNEFDTFTMRAHVSRWDQVRLVLGTFGVPNAIVPPQPSSHTAAG